MKFSALNIDFDRPSLDFLRSRKPAHKVIKKQYSRKSLCYTVVSQSFIKTVADHHGQQALVTSFLVVSTSMILKDPELPK